MSGQSVFTNCFKRGLLFVATLFLVHEAVQAAEAKTATNNGSNRAG